MVTKILNLINRLVDPVYLLFAFLLSIFIFIGIVIIHFEAERFSSKESKFVLQALHEIKAPFESRLYSNLHRAEGVKALVAMNPYLTQEDYARAMEVQFKGKHDLRNIGLAKGMVISYMYPLEGNEQALGLDFTKTPEQFEAADLTRRLNKIVLAGPVNLVQGGTGLIARVPIFIKKANSNKEEFWGLASVVINIDSLFEGAGLKSEVENVKIAIRGKDAQGEDGEQFFGEEIVFASNPITQNIDLPHGRFIGSSNRPGSHGANFKLKGALDSIAMYNEVLDAKAVTTMHFEVAIEQ